MPTRFEGATRGVRPTRVAWLIDSYQYMGCPGPPTLWIAVRPHRIDRWWLSDELSV